MDNAGLINLQLHLPSASPTPSTTGQDYFDQTRPAQNEGSTPSAQSSTSTVRFLFFFLSGTQTNWIGS